MKAITFNKKAQIMGLPFQIIFSLFLIAAFIMAAIAGVKYFMATSEHAKINLFINNLNAKAQNAYLADEISQSYEILLPTRIKYVCFVNKNSLTLNKLNNISQECAEFKKYLSMPAFKEMNMFFCPPKAAYGIEAPIYANIKCDTEDCLVFPKNSSFPGGIGPYCKENTQGKISIKLEKLLGEKEVALS